MALATLQSTLRCQGFSCVIHLYFLTGEFAAVLFLFSLVVGCISFSFRQWWDPVPAPNPATYTETMWVSGSPLELFEGGNFFLGVLAVLN